MEEDAKDLPELDSNRTSNYSHISQQVEDEIKRVEQILVHLESKTTQVSNQDHIAYRRMRGSLRKYLNVLYQARRFLSRHVPLVVIEQCLTRLISLQAVFKKYAAVFRNTPLAVNQFTQSANVLMFLVACVALMVESKKQEKECTGIFDSHYYLKNKAKSLCDNIDSLVPPSTLTACPVFLPPKKRSPKGDDDRDKDMKSIDDDTNNEASLVPCDDVSGNTDLDHSKSAISSGKKERTNDEAASTSSMSTSVHDQQHSQNGGEVVNEVPLTIPVQDTSSHTLVDDLHFSSGKNLPSTPLSVLELETKRTIASFNDTGELPVTIQQQDSQPEHVLPSGAIVNAVQESSGQNGTSKMTNTYQPTNVPSSEEKFMLSPRGH